ncbi:hypothetical protein AB833_02635 [Chromatiales bacterium (ex Bugula neritina AB1)]|nr:hypothetical protein AB833_02635 [Chromatiales bacterium (ex Bugula neritina AB1)]
MLFFALISLLFLHLLFWYYARKTLVLRSFDLLDLLLFIYLLKFLVRPAALIFRLDEPWLNHFVGQDDIDLAIIACLSVVLFWMVSLGVGVKVAHLSVTKPWCGLGKPVFTIRQFIFAAFVLLVVGALLVIPQIAQHGGISNLIYQSKLGDGVERAYRYPSLIGSIWAAAAIVSYRRIGRMGNYGSVDERNKVFFLIGVILFFGNSFLAFTYGARDAVVLGVVAIMLSVISLRELRLGGVNRLAVIGLIVLTLASVFRFFRDGLIVENVAIFDTSGVVRSIFQATNLLTFDSLLLAVRDFPSVFAYFGVEPFLGSVKTMPFVSYLFGEGGAEFENIAQRVIRLYIPWRKTGNPLDAVGDWYVCFGIVGLIVGGLVSGYVVGWFQKKLLNFRNQALLFVVSIHGAALIFPLGFSSTSVTRGVRFGVALMIVYVGMILISKIRVRSSL